MIEVRDLMECLTVRQRKVIEMRFFDGMSLRAIGETLQNNMKHKGNWRRRPIKGVRSETVRQIVSRALGKMRARARAMQWD